MSDTTPRPPAPNPAQGSSATPAAVDPETMARDAFVNFLDHQLSGHGAWGGA